ncbi:MAG: MerR family transcriptional regulator [Thermomicrobiales bacterium]
MTTFVPIGQFAALTQLSQKALCLYDENGLLPPAMVDPDSGYRYYQLDQVARAGTIRLLREADMPLADIRAFLAEPSAARLDAYEAALSRQHAQRTRVIAYLRRTLTQEGEPVSYTAKVKEVAAQPYASRTATVALGELGPFIDDSIRELSASVDPAGPPFSIFHGAVNDESSGAVEVCVPTSGAVAGGSALPAGPVAFTLAEGAQTDYPAITGAFEAVAVWAKEHGHELAGPPREIYLTDANSDGPACWEIAWPIR